MTRASEEAMRFIVGELLPNWRRLPAAVRDHLRARLDSAGRTQRERDVAAAITVVKDPRRTNDERKAALDLIIDVWQGVR